MYTESLTKTVKIKQDPFISFFLNEDYDCCIALLDNQLYLMEAEGDTSEPTKITNFINWLKQNAWQKPRAWFAKMLAKLNRFAAKIAFKEETDPGKRSLWSKVKAAISKAIVWITNKIEQFVRPNQIGEYMNVNPQSKSSKELDHAIEKGKELIDAVKDTKKKSAHLLLNRTFNDIYMDFGNKEKQKKMEKNTALINRAYERWKTPKLSTLPKLLPTPSK